MQMLKDAYGVTGMDDPDGYTGFMFDFDPAYMSRLFDVHCGHPKALCLIHDVGGTAQGLLMALASEHPFGPVWLAHETFWWIDPAHRGKAAFEMLKAYETWAKERGCAYVGMASKSNPTTVKLYERRGYHAIETHFLKALS